MPKQEVGLLNELIDAAVLDQRKARHLLRRHPHLLHARRSLGETALHFLAVEGYAESVRFLALVGANVNVQNEFGDTPLIDAALLGREDVVKTLLAFNADVNATSVTKGAALQCAISSGNPAVVDALLQAGANPSYRNELGETVFSSLPKSNPSQRQAILAVFKKHSIERSITPDLTP